MRWLLGEAAKDRSPSMRAMCPRMSASAGRVTSPSSTTTSLRPRGDHVREVGRGGRGRGHGGDVDVSPRPPRPSPRQRQLQRRGDAGVLRSRGRDQPRLLSGDRLGPEQGVGACLVGRGAGERRHHVVGGADRDDGRAPLACRAVDGPDGQRQRARVAEGAGLRGRRDEDRRARRERPRRGRPRGPWPERPPPTPPPAPVTAPVTSAEASASALSAVMSWVAVVVSAPADIRRERDGDGLVGDVDGSAPGAVRAGVD